MLSCLELQATASKLEFLGLKKRRKKDKITQK
jgi:hypothetical protein